MPPAMKEGEAENLRDLHYSSNSSLRKGRRGKKNKHPNNPKPTQTPPPPPQTNHKKINAQCSLKLRVLLCLHLHRKSCRSAPKSGTHNSPTLSYPQSNATHSQWLCYRRVQLSAEELYGHVKTTNTTHNWRKKKTRTNHKQKSASHILDFQGYL